MGRKVVFMIVNKINIQDIKPYENNAKKHDETQIKNVADGKDDTDAVNVRQLRNNISNVNSLFIC